MRASPIIILFFFFLFLIIRRRRSLAIMVILSIKIIIIPSLWWFLDFTITNLEALILHFLGFQIIIIFLLGLLTLRIHSWLIQFIQSFFEWRDNVLGVTSFLWNWLFGRCNLFINIWGRLWVFLCGSMINSAILWRRSVHHLVPVWKMPKIIILYRWRSGFKAISLGLIDVRLDFLSNFIYFILLWSIISDLSMVILTLFSKDLFGSELLKLWDSVFRFGTFYILSVKISSIIKFSKFRV